MTGPCAVYDVADRGRVVGRLRRIGEALRRCKKLDNPRISIIPRARIPIIKVSAPRERHSSLHTVASTSQQGHWSSPSCSSPGRFVPRAPARLPACTHVQLKVRNVNVDISISDDTGPRAARHMAQQVRCRPPLPPSLSSLRTALEYTSHPQPPRAASQARLGMPASPQRSFVTAPLAPHATTPHNARHVRTCPAAAPSPLPSPQALAWARQLGASADGNKDDAWNACVHALGRRCARTLRCALWCWCSRPTSRACT